MAKRRPKQQPTAEQINAVVKFFDASGTRWRSKLEGAWFENRGYPPGYDYSDCLKLHQLRLGAGYDWLKNFSPKRVDRAALAEAVARERDVARALADPHPELRVVASAARAAGLAHKMEGTWQVISSETDVVTAVVPDSAGKYSGIADALQDIKDYAHKRRA